MKPALAFAALYFGLATLAATTAPQAQPQAGGSRRATLQVGIRIKAADDPGNAWKSYETQVQRTLLASGTPRNVVLASLGYDKLTSDAPPAAVEGARLELFGAAMRAPDDALVQWLVANSLLGSRDYAHATMVVDNATRLESDNAAAWGLALALAASRNQPAGIDDALARMAASSRSDEHVTDTLHAWLDVYATNPPPRSMFVDPADADSVAFVAAMSVTAAVALPGYQSILQACKPPADGPLDSARASDCADAGRLMLRHAKSLIGRSIGSAMLRHLGEGVATAEDKAAERNLEWVMANSAMSSGFIDNNPLAMQAHEADWRNLDDEYDIMQRAAARAGLPIEAPLGWKPPHREAIADAKPR